MKIIHLSDTHFVPPGKKLYGREPKIALDAAIADINAHHADAELVIATGDLTHWGEPAAFDSLAGSFAALEPPLKLLIGNHDARETFKQYFPDQDGDGTGFIHSVQDTSAGRFVYLDTVLAGTHQGHFCAERCRWLSETLAASAGRDVFLFMHHPPFLIGLPALDAISLQQRDEFRAAVEPHKASIRHLFFGQFGAFDEPPDTPADDGRPACRELRTAFLRGCVDRERPGRGSFPRFPRRQPPVLPRRKPVGRLVPPPGAPLRGALRRPDSGAGVPHRR
jgi:3',5'-cyclic AMP phosphodiesterase CpdA